MAKRKQIEDDYRDSSDAKMQQSMLLLKRKNVKYKPIPKFKGGCNNC